MINVLSFDVGIRHLAMIMANIDREKRIFQLLDIKLVDIYSPSIYAAINNFITFARTIDLRDVKLIIIERQPPAKNDNIRMEIAIYTFLAMTKAESTQILLVHSSNKWAKMQIDMPKGKKNYYLRKKTMKELCEKICKGQTIYDAFCQKNKKIDDISDAILQAIYL